MSTSPVYRKASVSRRLCSLPLREDKGPNGLLGSSGARRQGKELEDPGLPQRTVHVPARHSPGTGRRRGPRRLPGLSGEGGDAESLICHCSSSLPALRGLKQKGTRMRLVGRPVPGPALATSPRERMTAGRRASGPVRARRWRAEARPWRGSGSGAARGAPCPRCCYCCSGRRRRRVGRARPPRATGRAQRGGGAGGGRADAHEGTGSCRPGRPPGG